MLDKELRQPLTITENGKKRTTTRLGAMTKRLVAAALSGDYKALITLLEILRKSGRLETVDVDNVFIEDYQSVLDAYVTKRMQKKQDDTTSESSSKKG